MKRFLMTILAIGIILPLCTQAVALSPDGDTFVVVAAPMSHAAADPCGHAQTGEQDIPAADCLAHCLSAKGVVNEPQAPVLTNEAGAACFFTAAVSDDVGPGGDPGADDDHILRLLLQSRLSGVIMRN
jgi:hypothetical protein